MLKLLHIVIGLVICSEIVWKFVGNLFEMFGKFVGNLWDIGVTLAYIKVLGIIG